MTVREICYASAVPCKVIMTNDFTGAIVGEVTEFSAENWNRVLDLEVYEITPMGSILCLTTSWYDYTEKRG